MCLGGMSQVSDLGSYKEVSAEPDIQSHRAPASTVDAMRLGLRRLAHCGSKVIMSPLSKVEMSS